MPPTKQELAGLNTGAVEHTEEPVTIKQPEPKAKGHGSFQEARDAAVRTGKQKESELRQREEFDKEVNTLAEHLYESHDWDKIKKSVTGEEELLKKIEGWRGGITPEAKAKIEKLRETHGTPAPAKQGESGTTPKADAGAASTTKAPTAQPAPEASKGTPDAGADPAKKPKFNPFTGEPLPEGATIKFDPDTGEPLIEEPKTGLPADHQKLLQQLRADLEKDLSAKYEAELKEIKDRAEAAEKERQEIIAERDRQKELRRSEEAKRTFMEFQYAAKAANIPDDLVPYAYERAREIASDPSLNPNINARDPEARQMSYDAIFQVMKQTNSSFFRTHQPQAAPADSNGAVVTGAISPKGKPGTGTPAGGSSTRSPNAGQPYKGADSFEQAGQDLRKRLAQKLGN